MSNIEEQTNDRRAAKGRGQETAITKNALGDTAMAHTGETAASTGAARQTAIVQSRITQSMMRPRVFEVVRERLMADCDRPRFAMSARYERPQGWLKDENGKDLRDEHGEKIRNFITGWSIRFVTAAVSALGNITPSADSIYEDDVKKIIRCEVWDYERNVSWSQEVTLEKTVERRFIKQGQVPIAKRQNSYGDPVYILPATDDEVRLKENRLVSMTLRTLGLRLVPGDLLDEALERVAAAREKALAAEREGVVADPSKAKRDFLDKMAKIGIRAVDIVEYLGGRSLDAATPDMILELRIVGAGVVSGDITWRDALAGSPYREQTAEGAGEKPEDEKASAAREKIAKTLAEQKARAAAKKEPKPGETPPAAAPPATPAPKMREPTPESDGGGFS